VLGVASAELAEHLGVDHVAVLQDAGRTYREMNRTGAGSTTCHGPLSDLRIAVPAPKPMPLVPPVMTIVRDLSMG
jgi:hypothetical protein